MRKLPLIAAVASALGALPAFADRCDDDWRYLHVDNSHYYRGGVCRDVTIRELCGDEVVVRHVRRCD
jgi:hypothetical protein